MDGYDTQLERERAYLRKVVSILREKIETQSTQALVRAKRVASLRHNLSDEISNNPADFDRFFIENNQYVQEDNRQTRAIAHSAARVEAYGRMLPSPYFGRMDISQGGEETEKLYIGLHNVTYGEDEDVYVYDWRAPVCSMFYEYEPGPASYQSPVGSVSCKLEGKRQYKIENSKLLYFFDCNLAINDEILCERLAQNASPKMQAIIETIQRDQDIVIRDAKSPVLLVQGAAGSGKTVVALHRIAWLLYRGRQSGLTSGQILILSPNGIFSSYISGVLPQLGEENVNDLTFDDLFRTRLHHPLQSREAFAEETVGTPGGELAAESYAFKGSEAFLTILDRFLLDYERRLIPFTDVYFDGRMVIPAQLVKESFLDNKIHMPARNRINRMMNRIFAELHPLQRKKAARLGEKLKGMQGHDYDYRTYARYLSIRETLRLKAQLEKAVSFDCLDVYRGLFEEPLRLEKMAQGVALPENFDQIVRRTRENLARGEIACDDAAPLFYLSLRLAQPKSADIRHVVVDEAQEYLPLHYKILGILYRNASFTVLGDAFQSLLPSGSAGFYETAGEMIGKRNFRRLTLTKSYRSSAQIMSFAQGILGGAPKAEAFARNETRPELLPCADTAGMDDETVRRIETHLKNGFGSVAVLCKTEQEARGLFERIKDRISVRYIERPGDILSGAMILPVFRSKGLEFDAVAVYNASSGSYRSEIDRRLLYVACTRALHRLDLLYAGLPSRFLPREDRA